MYDPRLVGEIDPATGAPSSGYVKFAPWQRQRQFLDWLEERYKAKERGAGPKSRDQGVSTLCCLFALHKWLFVPGFKSTFGSRDKDLVDKLNSTDSLFQKIRISRHRLPKWMLPAGFDERKHDVLFLMTNPATGATIGGEGGDDMGRGGRSSVYFADEVAFMQHPKATEASIMGNTDCAIFISTVNRQGDFFDQLRVMLPARQVFVLHWRDDPRKGEEWAEKKRSESVDPTAFAREYDIDSSASTDDIIIPARFVLAAQKLTKLMVIPKGRKGVTGGDVGGGKAKSVVITRFGPLVLPPERRGDPDTTDTAYWMLDHCKAVGSTLLNFDTVGIGEGVKSTLAKAEAAQYANIVRVPVNTGVPPFGGRVWADGRRSTEIFGNLKAEIWWLARTAFERTYQLVQWLESGGKSGIKHDIMDCIALPDDPILAAQLSIPKRMRNEKGLLTVEKKEDLRKRGIVSPDEAEAFVLTFLEDPNDAIPTVAPNPDEFHRANPAKMGQASRDHLAGGEGSLIGGD